MRVSGDGRTETRNTDGAFEIPIGKRPTGVTVMTQPSTRPAATKPAGASFDLPKTPEAFREAAEQGSAQARQAYERVGAATQEASNTIKNAYSTAAQGAVDYNVKLIEVARANINAA